MPEVGGREAAGPALESRFCCLQQAAELLVYRVTEHFPEVLEGTGMLSAEFLASADALVRGASGGVLLIAGAEAS